jgi:hypothetical protein
VRRCDRAAAAVVALLGLALAWVNAAGFLEHPRQTGGGLRGNGSYVEAGR